jgi:pilus assembly protein CpaC
MRLSAMNFLRQAAPRFFVLVVMLVALTGPSSVCAEAVKAKAPAVSSALDVFVDKGVPVTLSAPAATVFIANPDVADVQVMSPTSIMVYGKKTGQTTLMASDNAGKTLLLRTVFVKQNLDDLAVALNAVIPNNKIKAETVPNGIVLSGEAKDAGMIEDARRLALRYVAKAGEVINRIKVGGSNQIHIRVRFAEVSRDADKRFGIDWETVGDIGGFTFGIMSGSAANVISNGANLLGRTRPTTGTNTNDIISFSSRNTRWNINGLIDALAAEGFVTVLAEPNLTAMSGETASFLAGGEFPVPVPQSLGTTTIEWKTYGVSLAFTPSLIGGNRLNLHVRPEVSQLSEAGAVTINGITVPALTTRRAETTIELASGQSFAIGGLLNNNQTQSVSKYPFLGDMPILGALFRSTRFQNNQTELVIIITPYIVKPSTEENLALPLDGYSPPSDIDRIFSNRMTDSNPDARPFSGTPRAVYVGPAEEQTPASAPVTPVTPVLQESRNDPAPSAPPVSNSLSSPPRSSSKGGAPTSLAPAGAGGFIVE